MRYNLGATAGDSHLQYVIDLIPGWANLLTARPYATGARTQSGKCATLRIGVIVANIISTVPHDTRSTCLGF